MSESVRNPEVAVNQVWEAGIEDGWQRVVVTGFGVGEVVKTTCGIYGRAALLRCIGVDTPAGRVMVGERREAPSGVHTVLAVASPDGPYDIAWAHTVCDRDGESHLPADLVASWPLLPALAPDPAPHLPSADPLCAPIPDAAGIVSRAVAEWMEKHREGEAREVRRREIDAVLAEDARRFPAFATARRSWMLAVYEKHERGGLGSSSEVATWAAGTLMIAHQYESERGGARTPRPEALAIHLDRNGNRRAGVAAYERARSLP